jgi:ketoreductase RED2
MAVRTERVALVTGSTSGIGEAVVRRLAGEGIRVVANSVTSVDAGHALVSDIGPELAHYVQGDIANPDDAARLVAETIERFGRLDILVNNAGTTVRIPHEDFDAASPEVFRRLFEINVIGTWQVTVAAMPHLKATGAGSIVNVSSIAGLRPLGSSVPYGVSKAALNQLTTMLANVTGPEVRINAVAPGLVDTPWTAAWTDLHELIKIAAPMGRAALPEDVAQVIHTLIDAPYITGQIWVIDGGLTLR